jgi:hypothetical protein
MRLKRLSKAVEQDTITAARLTSWGFVGLGIALKSRLFNQQ